MKDFAKLFNTDIGQILFQWRGERVIFTFEMQEVIADVTSEFQSIEAAERCFNEITADDAVKYVNEIMDQMSGS